MVGGLVGKNEGTVTTSYYYNTTQAGTYVTGTGTPGKLCFYLAEKSTFDKKGTKDDTGARTEMNSCQAVCCGSSERQRQLCF